MRVSGLGNIILTFFYRFSCKSVCLPRISLCMDLGLP